MKKNLIFIALLMTLSCRKESTESTTFNAPLTSKEAKRYYEGIITTQKYRFSNGNESPVSETIKPDWENTIQVSSGSYSVVEIPIAISKNEVNTYQLNGENVKDNGKRAEFSLSRLIVYKDSTESLGSNIITYIPDIRYIEKRENIGRNTFLKMSTSFTGYIEFKTLTGQPNRLLRIENGEIVHSYRLSGSSIQKQGKSNYTTSSSCYPVCTPIYQTICAGPGGPGTGFDEDWVCTTTEIGSNCIMICVDDGSGGGPNPGGPGGSGGDPGTTGIFGLNGSNAVVESSNFDDLIEYVIENGYRVSDAFSTTLTVDGKTYQGEVVEIYDAGGKVISAYFSPNQSQSPFNVGFYYNIGEGNSINTSSETPKEFFSHLPAIGANIIWTNGTSSPSSISAEADLNLSDNDPEIAEWNNGALPQYAAVEVPAFATMYANYPKNANGGDMPAPDVYALVGGAVLAAYQADPAKYRNACALRVSRALNYSGVNIPAIPGQTTKGADGKNYFLSSVKLYNYIKWVFPNSSKTVVMGADGGPQGTLFREKLRKTKGIYIMQPNWPSQFGALGHATLWTGTMAIGGHDYFNATGGVYRITVWYLP